MWIRAGFSSFSVLAERNKVVLKTALEATTGAAAAAATKKARDYYAKCMDMDAIDAAGATPVQPMLQAQLMETAWGRCSVCPHMNGRVLSIAYITFAHSAQNPLLDSHQ